MKSEPEEIPIMKIFYSWQNDIDPRFNRNFIQDCLKRVIKKLNHNLFIEEAIRLDHDTKDITGSPDITNTILKKIDECDVFIGDITFVSKLDNGKYCSNPNVLIELGYALKSLGDGRLINIMNTSFGKPDDLPFDLRHKRWPVKYELSDRNFSEKDQIRNDFVKALYTAIVPFTKNPKITGNTFSSNAEKIHHAEKLRKDFNKELAKIRAEGLNGDVVIRDIDRFDGYPNDEDTNEGISPSFRVGLIGTYTKGVKVSLMIGSLTHGEYGYRFTNHENGEEGDITVFLIGEIPYTSILDVNWDGDEYYGFPHVYCYFDHDGGPYENLDFCKRIDMENGPVHYQKVASLEKVRENSKGTGVEYFS